MSIDLNLAIDYFYDLRSKHITYSMTGSRDGSDGSGDCSGVMTRSLQKAGLNKPSYLYSTETLHQYLIDNGFQLIAFNQSWSMQRGDVIILGLKGQSAGAGGHTALAIDNNNIIHCNYNANGVSVNNENILPYSMGFYVYRYTQLTPQKPTNNENWIAEKGHFKTNTGIVIRTSANTNSDIFGTLYTGQVAIYDAYKIDTNGYVWVRQPRPNGYGYIATGKSVNGKRVNYWGSFY